MRVPKRIVLNCVNGLIRLGGIVSYAQRILVAL